MKLEELVKELTAEEIRGSLDKEISGVIYDSRKDCAGALFICISGTKVDAHTFLPQVIEKGAAAVVVEREVEIPENVTVIRVADARLALAELSAAWFGYPTRKMTTIGLTGTKGKTTSTYMLKAILEAAGKKVGLVGTNGAVIAGKHYVTNNTTPESYELQQYFHQMVEAGCEYMIMEVSSQGLKMNRVAGISFDYGVFTNISPDHIGPNEHADFEEYMACKGKLFTMCSTGIVNRDDPNWENIVKGHTCKLYTFGCTPEADFEAVNIRHLKKGSFMGIGFDLKGKAEFPVEVNIPGMFSVYNALSAVSVAVLLGIGSDAIDRALASLKVDGRMELVYASDHCTVIVDYAHNGVSTRSLLSTLRDYNPHRLVVVFGCGGNRDPHRRYEMGEAAGHMADLSIVTADNSRWEKVENIIKDIHIGLDPTGGKYIDIPDRREAIRYSISHAEPGDVIAIIGKGHEDYQEVNGVKTHFLDREVVEEMIKELGYK